MYLEKRRGKKSSEDGTSSEGPVRVTTVNKSAWTLNLAIESKEYNVLMIGMINRDHPSPLPS